MSLMTDYNKSLSLPFLVLVVLALISAQCSLTSKSESVIFVTVTPQPPAMAAPFNVETEPPPILSSARTAILGATGAVQGNSLILMVTPATVHLSPGEKLTIFYGVENNRAELAEGFLFVELLLPDGTSVPISELYGEHFSIAPLARTGKNVTLDIGALTDQTGEMVLHFRCEENGVEISRRSFAFTVGQPAPAFFTDVTSEVGVLLQHVPNPEDEMPFGNGVAFADYNRDGHLDIYVTNQLGHNALFHNNGDGTFTDQAVVAGVASPAILSTGAVFADYDNDGDRDLYILTYGPNLLFRNNGDGTFTDVTAIAGVDDAGRGVTAAWGDYDQDGYLDLYVANHTSRLVHDYSHVRLGTEPRPAPDARDRLYHNDGDGTFSDVTGFLGMEDDQTATGFVASFVDYDDDGDPDIYLVNDVFIGRANRGNILWRNDGPDGRGGWRFTDVSTVSDATPSLFGMGLAVGDYNNDGFQDLYMSNAGRPYLYRNNGNGTFADVTDQAGVGYAHLNEINTFGWGAAFFDYDNDGWLDTYLNTGNMMYAGPHVETDPRYQPNVLFRNNHDGTFTDVSGLSGANHPERSRAVAYGDYNNDGYLDLYLSNFAGPTALYRNEGGSNNWLAIKLEGTTSNRDGIGAKVRVTIDGLTQLREIRSGSNHGSGSEIGAYFGMGQNVQADVVEISWPSGLVQIFNDVAVNQNLDIVEEEDSYK